MSKKLLNETQSFFDKNYKKEDLSTKKQEVPVSVQENENSETALSQEEILLIKERMNLVDDANLAIINNGFFMLSIALFILLIASVSSGYFLYLAEQSKAAGLSNYGSIVVENMTLEEQLKILAEVSKNESLSSFLPPEVQEKIKKILAGHNV